MAASNQHLEVSYCRALAGSWGLAERTIVGSRDLVSNISSVNHRTNNNLAFKLINRLLISSAHHWVENVKNREIKLCRAGNDVTRGIKRKKKLMNTQVMMMMI